MRLVVTGRDGQLGRWLVRLAGRSEEIELVAAVDFPQIDFGDPDRTARLLDEIDGPGPDVLINAAAYTAVDRCEEEEALALTVNGESPGRLAAACRRAGVRFVHVSTDFVFGGGSEPIPEEAEPTPASAYGRTKRAGECRVLEESPEALVVRTSWLFGPGNNFVRTMVEQAEKRVRGEVTAPLRVVADQHGRPTYAADLAQGILGLLRTDARGLVHVCNDDVATWWELARAALDAAGYRELEIQRIKAEEYPRPARTPMYSVLSLERARGYGVSLRPWRAAVADYIASEDGPARREAA